MREDQSPRPVGLSVALAHPALQRACAVAAMFSDSLSDKPGTDPALRQTSRWTQTQAEANVYSFKQEP